MNPWMLLSIAVVTLSAAGGIYLVTRIGKFTLIRRLTKNSLPKRLLIGLIVTAAACYALYLGIGVINMMICVLHLGAIWLLADLIALIVRKIRRKRGVYYLAGVGALVFTAVWLCYGWYSAHHVVRTEYALETEKNIGEEPIRIVMFADSHIGATFHSAEFAEYCRRMEAENPDVLVIVGDYVDDDTTREDMLACCEALGSIHVKHGVWFVYGNHDRGYFQRSGEGFTYAEMEAELEKNGVHILIDETELIDNRFYLVGREDARYTWRASMDSLVQNLDPDIYTVVLDHEPHDYAAQEKSGVDLVLSGHTHGGWLFPFNNLAYITHSDDWVYGYEKRSNTEYIVTSGISDWALKFKTGCIAEYVVVDIQ